MASIEELKREIEMLEARLADVKRAPENTRAKARAEELAKIIEEKYKALIAADEARASNAPSQAPSEQVKPASASAPPSGTPHASGITQPVLSNAAVEQKIHEWSHISEQERELALSNEFYFKHLLEEESKAAQRARRLDSMDVREEDRERAKRDDVFMHALEKQAQEKEERQLRYKGVMGVARRASDTVDTINRTTREAKELGRTLTAPARMVGKGYNKLNSGFMNAQDQAAQAISSTLKGGKQAIGVAHSWFFVLAALLIHFYDAVSPTSPTNFALTADHRMFMFVFYALLAFWASFFYYRTRFTTKSIEYFTISLVAFLLPYLRLIPYFDSLPFVANNFTIMLLLFPIWFYYIVFNERVGSPIRNLGIILFTITILIFFIILIMNVTLPEFATPGGGLNLGESWNYFTDNVKESWMRLKEGVLDSGIISIPDWRRKLNETFNPSAAFYAAQVEDNEGNTRLGVFIENVRPLHEVFFEGSPIVLLGTIKAETFLPGGVRIWPDCRLEGYPRNYQGLIDEDDIPIDVNLKLYRNTRCTVPWHRNMTNATSFTAYLTATFDFETWSYVEYTFVSRKTIENYYYQDQDINDALHIPRYTEAVYTAGPVMLGLSANEQPISIDLEASTADRIIEQRLGWTYSSSWPQGELLKVYEVELIVPEPFRLERCEPANPRNVEYNAANRTRTYRFAGEILENPRYDYRTVTCELEVSSLADARSILQFGEKVPVTMVAITRYKYKIEEQAGVRVDK